MKLADDAVLSTRPVVTRTPSGRLAVSAPGSAIKIGVTGATRAQVRQNFAAEIRAWAALVERQGQTLRA